MWQLGATLARQWLKHRRFDRQLAAMSDILARGTDRAWHQQHLINLAQVLMARPTQVLSKGEPDLAGMKRRLAEELRDMVIHAEVLPQALEIAESLAAVDPCDAVARAVWLHAFVLCHAEAIEALSRLSAPCVALHMSCTPRLERARASSSSFSAIAPDVLRHVHLVGHGQPYAVNEDEALLKVPAQDTYEHLPSKVVDAYALLACVPAVQAVFKMDDDHRQGDPVALESLLRRVARCRHALQIGHVYHTPYPAAHSHGWHLGKCKDPAFSKVPFGFPAPLSWVTGEFGYVLNRPALLKMLWARVYYRRWLQLVVYEDVALGEIAEKLNIYKIPHQMDKVLSFHGGY